MKFNKSDVVRGSRVGIPRDNYTVRCLAAKKDQSKKGFEMSVADFEITAPESFPGGDGAPVMIAGTKFRVWFLHEPTESWGQARVMDFAAKVGMSEDAQEDTDVFRDEIVGKLFNWILSSEETFKRYGRNDPDPERAGKEILNAEGQKISDGFRVKAEIDDVVGAAV